MATSMPNPQASAPQPQGQDAGAPANPLQQTIGKLALIVRQLGSQNTVIQPECQQASQLLIQALQKVSQASQSAPQMAPAPTQQ